MKLYLGLTENSSPDQTRIFVDVNGKLVDLNLSYAAYLAKVEGEEVSAYELAAYYFPPTIDSFLERGEQARKVLEQIVSFTRKIGACEMRGPGGEKATYDPTEIRILPPFQKPEKSFVIGFSDQARVEAMPKPEIPTGFYKLPPDIRDHGRAHRPAEIFPGSRRRRLPRHSNRQGRQKSPPRAGLGLRRRRYALNRHHGARHQPARRPDDQ